MVIHIGVFWAGGSRTSFIPNLRFPPLGGSCLCQTVKRSLEPGITCLWQVSGRSDLPFDRQVELDIDYARTRSLALDASILLRTVPAVLFARGAY